MACICMTRGARTQDFVLNAEATLGRSSKNLIRVPEGNASRHHARIFKEGDNYTIEDLNSSNGTYVNETRITRQVLNENDVIRIGKTLFTFSAADDDPLIGQDIRGYIIKRRLGKGGMGTVYLALQRSMDRDVALKILKPELSNNPEFITRFEEEARFAGRLNHRNIIGVHDFGSTSSLHFFSMEYVQGEDLQNRIDREKVLSLSVCITILKQAALGLSHAHGMGILHQDIKPLNIMLAEDETVKIADLGLARTMSYHQDETIVKQKLIGTPQYMAPEVLQRHAPDVRSDIYSLGATLYHMVAGRAPFLGENSAEIIRQRLQGEPENLTVLSPKIPVPFASFVHRMMSKSPEARPQSLEAVLKELDCLISILPSPVQDVAALALDPLPVTTPKVDSNKRFDNEVDTLRKSVAAERINTQRPAFKKIHYIGGGLVCILLLSISIWILFFESAEDKAKIHWLRAESMIADKEPQQAIDQLNIILQNFPNTKMANQAARLQESLQTEMSIDDISAQHAKGNISTVVARDKLLRHLSRLPEGRLLQKTQDLLDELRVASEASGKTSALPAWKNTNEEIDQLVLRGNIKDAMSVLNSYLKGQPESKERSVAEERLRELEKSSSTPKEDKEVSSNPEIITLALKEANTLATNGNFLAAWKHLFESFSQTQNPVDRGRLIAEMVSLDRPMRSEINRFLQNKAQNLMTFQLDSLLKEIDDHQKNPRGFAWQNFLKHEFEQVGMVRDYRQSLDRYIEMNLDKGRKFSLSGFRGLYRISLDKNEQPILKSEGGADISIEWKDVDQASLWNLFDLKSASARERAGAAVYSGYCKHHGYSQSYLQGIEENPAIGSTVSYLQALQQNQYTTATYDFSSDSLESAWTGTHGNWDTTQQTLTATGERSHAILFGKILSLSNSQLQFSLQLQAGDGRFRVIFDSGDQGEVVLEIRKNSSQIFCQKNTESPVSATGDAPKEGDIIRLTLSKEKIELHSGNSSLCSVTTAFDDQWAVLRIEFDALSGSLDNVLIKEGF